MYKISFVSANLVAREVGYSMGLGWKQGDFATNAYFRPIQTFEERFSLLIHEIKETGYKYIDLWSAHLNPLWFTSKHIETARNILRKHQVEIISLAGKFGDSLEEFERVCIMANHLSVSLLGGVTPVLTTSRNEVIKLLEKYNLQLALENHPEKNPSEMIEEIGDTRGRFIGTTIDTGWYATHNFNVPQAIRVLGNSIFHVHLKDILVIGEHKTCKFGNGVVPMSECLEALLSIGYKGTLSIEHEPETYNPLPECKYNLTWLENHLKN